ncbi:MAG: PAS domain S-box protein [Hyphomicrobiales bacterium]|nr:PAS domain S-box protein [Hyphomicrobiales bacterium]
MSSNIKSPNLEWLGHLGHKKLLRKMLSRDAVIVYSPGLDKIIWANTSGAGLFGGTSIQEFMAASIQPDHPFLGQVKAAVRQLDKERIYRGFRVVNEGHSRFLQCEIGFIKLKGTGKQSGGNKAIIITCANPVLEDLREHEFTNLVLENIADIGSARAICDEFGLVISATEEFAEVGILPDIMEKSCLKIRSKSMASMEVSGENKARVSLNLYLLATSPKRILVLAGDNPQISEQSDKTEIIDEPEVPEKLAMPLSMESPIAGLKNEDEREDEKPSDVSDKSSSNLKGEEEAGDGGDRIDEEISPVDNKLDTALFGDQSDKSDDFSENETTASLEEEISMLVKIVENGNENLDNKTGFDERQDEFEFSNNTDPVRFAWITNTDQVFTSVSEELAEAVGPNAADIVGRKWSDVATVFGFDGSGEILSLLKNQDTWSGKSVFWPVQGTDLQVPIDLAALPTFSSGRNFDGFRGFGIVRLLDTIVDPDETGMALAGADASILEHDEAANSAIRHELENENNGGKQITANRDQKSKLTNIVDISSRRGSTREKSRQQQDDDPELTNKENRAFHEIGQKLRDTSKYGVSRLHRNHDIQQNENNSEDQTYSLVSENDLAKTDQSDDHIQDKNPNLLNNDSHAETDPEKIDESISPRVDTSLLERLPVPVLIFRDEKMLFANQELLTLTGYDNFQELRDAGDIHALFGYDDSAEIRDNNEVILNDRDGGQMRVKALLQSVPWDAGSAMLLSFRQPRHDKLAENEKIVLDMMRVSELHNVLDTATDGIIILDKDGIVQSINQSAEALFGRADKDVSEKSVNLLFASESHDRISEYLANLAETNSQSLLNDGCEVIGVEANGGLIPLYVTIGNIGSSDKFCAILRDMTPWKKTREELVEARKQAESANEQKTEFLARISHEIRTPLNAIIGFSDVMIEERFGPVDNERYREYLRDINRSGIHVLDLINDLLDISKIEAGKMELSFEAVDLNLVVGETVALLQPQANGNRVLIRTSLSRAVPKVVADARSIRQIVLNLVSNAIKFTESNGQVIISTVYEGNGEVALRVRDTGRGMSKEEVTIALKPFRQVNVVSETRGQGTGLGLPLAKALVEANKAYFDIESEPGEGTIVLIQFPTQRVLAD